MVHGHRRRAPPPPGHVEEGDAVVVRLGLAHHAVLLLVDVAARLLDARVLVRPVVACKGGCHAWEVSTPKSMAGRSRRRSHGAAPTRARARGS